MNNRKCEALAQIARVISEEECSKAGIFRPQLVLDDVPPAIRRLLPHAEILGVGDDRVRGKIFDLVSHEYASCVRREIAECPDLGSWYHDSEGPDRRNVPEVAAIGWMLIGLNVIVERKT